MLNTRLIRFASPQLDATGSVAETIPYEAELATLVVGDAIFDFIAFLKVRLGWVPMPRRSGLAKTNVRFTMFMFLSSLWVELRSLKRSGLPVPSR